MNIVVCIKQVPDTSDIKWSRNNTIIREGLESILNPCDAWAIEFALKIKEKIGGKITAITMGPTQAENVLRLAIALGCDEGILISDKKFAASDTIATSKILSAAIKKIDFNLIICGQFAIDGDTAQTPSMIAQNLNLPQITFAKNLIEVTDNNLIVEKETEDFKQLVSVEIPALIAVTENNYTLIPPKINGYKKGQNAEIKKFDFESLKLAEHEVGIKGSPTYVSKAFRPDTARNCVFYENSDTGNLAEILNKEINL